MTVKGPRGELKKDLKHLAVSFEKPAKSDNTILISLHHGNRKNVAALRTVRSLIHNMVVGVTKGYKYKMRYVYAHFPINVNIEKNKETGLGEVEIRWVKLWICAEEDGIDLARVLEWMDCCIHDGCLSPPGLSQTSFA